MHEVVLNIGSNKYKATLDFYVIIKTQEYLKENGFEFAVHEIFNSLSDAKNLNMFSVCSLTVKSISRAMSIDEDTIANEIMDLNIDSEEWFISIFDFLNSLIQKCMPPSNSNDDSIFDDDLDFETKSNDDWDFPFMEYTWATILKRTDDFYKITPKTFFQQMEVYKRINNIETDNVVYL